MQSPSDCAQQQQLETNGWKRVGFKTPSSLREWLAVLTMRKERKIDFLQWRQKEGESSEDPVLDDPGLKR